MINSADLTRVVTDPLCDPTSMNFLDEESSSWESRGSYFSSEESDELTPPSAPVKPKNYACYKVSPAVITAMNNRFKSELQKADSAEFRLDENK